MGAIEPTRTRLELALCHEEYGNDACGNVCIHAGKDSVCAFRSAVNVVLDELMEPGEEAQIAGAWHFGDAMNQLPSDDYHDKKAGVCFRAMLTAIREGK